MLTHHVFLVPHVPTLLVDEHRGHRTEMIEALERAAASLHADLPDILVVLSARWQAAGPFLVDVGKRHQTITDYTGFGVEVRYDCDGHPALARALVEAGQKTRVHVGPTNRGVDSGVTVPLHFLAPGRVMPVVPISISRRSPEECRVWGATIRRVLAARPERIGFVVGGQLSFDEHAWTLRREVAETRQLDDKLIGFLTSGDWAGLSSVGGLVEKAKPQAALRHLELLRGFLGPGVSGELRCYEGGPGVGAALVEFAVAEEVVTPPSAAAEDTGAA